MRHGGNSGNRKTDGGDASDCDSGIPRAQTGERAPDSDSDRSRKGDCDDEASAGHSQQSDKEGDGNLRDVTLAPINKEVSKDVDNPGDLHQVPRNAFQSSLDDEDRVGAPLSSRAPTQRPLASSGIEWLDRMGRPRPTQRIPRDVKAEELANRDGQAG